jgi:hypothetical protein
MILDANGKEYPPSKITKEEFKILEFNYNTIIEYQKEHPNTLDVPGLTREDVMKIKSDYNYYK